MNNPLGNSDRLKNVLIFVIVFTLLVLICMNGFQYFFNVNITAYFADIFTTRPKLDIVVNHKKKQQSNNQNANNNNNNNNSSTMPKFGLLKQVYNIPGNHYDYENAKAVCSAYGSELATYNQIEDAYKEGAEWCNYGWSENQIALFPTQEKTYNHLQTIEGHEHDCGRPGINGGYIADANVKLGVNCYGKKPRITKEEDELMKTSSQYPVTPKDKLFDKRVEYWKGQINQILVSPFNPHSWGAL